MKQKDAILLLLGDHKWYPTRAILAAIQCAGGVGTGVSSRIAELKRDIRRKGWAIVHQQQKGTHYYKLKKTLHTSFDVW